ncbi:MAG: orotate phosphoribosyltransferase [Armatimonadota bacterium]|nr:orotate phosphoribosyltransferase [Armatimonadota bacterium]MDR7543987.1 orotate phosphoribosyltransferase [Armatimonadota bacterium]
MSVDWLARFQRYGAVQHGHFLLTSGLHSPLYVQCALILQYPREAAALGEALAARVRDARPGVVVGPALGAVLVAHEVARALGVRALFAERAAGTLALRRGFVIAPGERVLVVEDVVTTGTTTLEVVELVRQAGGVVAGAAALIDRTAGRWPLDVPLQALARLDAPTYGPDRCPQCRSGIPLVKPGSREGPPKTEH